MSQDSESDDEGYMCMELPTLIKQLRSVLDQYPDDGQILKELIQNAEDAEASEMRILYDVRHIDPDSRLLKKKRYLASLQAPALCVYNDALFTEKDWRGIKMLHDSVKEEEPLKVGRFGLGFKSVFHVTDFPCVISGDTVLFINPQEKNSDRVCYMKKLRDLSNEIKKMILNVFSGIFDFTSDTVHKGYYSGTIFWFPLRTNISKLSDNLYTEEKVKDLFQAFKSEASITLLFLKSIEKIQLYQRLSRKIQVRFSLQLSQDCLQHVRTEKQDFMRKVKQAQGGIPAASVESQLTLTVETVNVAGPKSSQQWIVINFYKGGTMSPRFRDLCSDKALSYAPYVGLAVPLGQQCKGHVFCFLPLPLESRSPTGLQVHVNGFFALNQNRRHVKWPKADQLQNQAHTDKAMEWNKCLVSEVLPEVYYSIVNALVQCCKVHTNSIIIIQQIYRMIPDIDDVDVNWKPLVSTLLKQLHNIPLLFTPSHQRMGIKMKDAFLVDVANDAYSLIVEIFTLYKKYIVPVPSKLMKTLEKHFSSHIHKVTPKDVCDTLRLSNNFTRLPRQKKLMLLKYLLESDQYKHLEGLCLLPVADGNFVAFGAPAAVFICDQPEDVKLFPGLESQLVSLDLPEDLHQALMKRAGGGWKGLSVMSSAAFPGLLQKCLLRHFPEGKAKLPSPSLDVSWLRQVWIYITAHGFDVESVFSGFLIVPDIDASGRGRLHSIDDVFIAQSVRHSESLPPNVGAALKKLGIVHLRYVPDFVLKNSHVLGTIIQYSNPVGVVRALEKVYRRKLITAVQLFNSESYKQERSALVAYMRTCQRQLSKGSKAVLRKLQLFTATDNSDCSVETLCTLAPDEQIPVPYPERYIQCSSAAVRHLALTLGATERPFLDVSRQILQMMLHNKRKYTESHTVDFMEFLMENHLHIVNKTRQIASEVRFLSSSGGSSGLRACDLFSQDDPFLKDLFLGEDKFPADRHTQTDRLREGLLLLGLKTEKDISKRDIVSTAETIKKLFQTKRESEAKCKVTALILFLKNNIECHEDIKTALHDISFLPVLKCPPSWPLPWKGEKEKRKIVACPKELYDKNLSSLVACSQLILDHHVDSNSGFDIELLSRLGVNRREDVDVSVVANQLVYVSQEMNSLTSDEKFIELERICKDIYKFMNKIVENDQKNHEQTLQFLREKDAVLTGKQMIKPCRVAFNLPCDLSPFLYEADKSLSVYKSFLVTIGVRDSFEVNGILNCIEKITREADAKTVSEERLTWLGRATLYLSELVTSVSLPEGIIISLPDEYRIMSQVDSLCLDDCRFVCKNEKMRFVHPCIHQSAAKLLGVKGKREVDLKENIQSFSPCFSEFGAGEDLTTRLKGLLSGYPCDSSILKELLQNADDAEATKLMFLKDFRHLPTEKLLNDRLSSVQGPALCVYNNAYFTEDDLEGIQKLGVGSKNDDPLKTGQYGVGFNVVYHLTDVPSFITAGPGTDKTICFLDPHVKYVPHATSEKPGVRISQLNELREKYTDTFSGYLEDRVVIDISKENKGTLFRFPLRTREMAAESKIKVKEVSPQDVSELLDEFRADMPEFLLFLQHVKQISIASITEDGRLDVEYCVEATMSENDMSVHDGYMSHLKNQTQKIRNPSVGFGLEDVSPLEVELSLSIKESEGRRQHWVVFLHSGFSKATPIPEALISAWEDGEIRLLPRGGVAMLLCTEEKKEVEFQGKAFCTLPLPIHTGLPVHVNGNFAFDHESRRNLWYDNKDYRSCWNEHVVNAIIVPAYIAAMQSMKTRTGSTKVKSQNCVHEYLDCFYSFFPDRSHTKSQLWNDLVVSFYTDVVSKERKLFAVVKPSGGMFADFKKEDKEHLKCKVLWVPASCKKGFPGYFNNLEIYFPQKKSQSDSTNDWIQQLQPQEVACRLTEILKDLQMKVIYSPGRILKIIADTCMESKMNCVTPKSVIDFLKSHSSVSQDRCSLGSVALQLELTVLKHLKSLELLTRFCQLHEDFSSALQSLPLAVTESMKLCTFDASNPFFVTRFTDLLAGTPDLLLHKDIVGLYENYIETTPVFKELDIIAFSKLIEQTLSKNIFCTGRPVPWQNSDFPSQHWIRDFWEFLFTQTNNSTSPLDLTYVEDWSLFPSTKDNGENLILYPIKKSGSVIDSKSVSPKKFETALRNMDVPQLDSSLFCGSVDATRITSSIAASLTMPVTVLKLLSNFDFSTCRDITAVDCRAFLQFFSENVDKINDEIGEQRTKQLLTQIPIFESMSEELVALHTHQRHFVVKDYSTGPSDGVSDWTRGTSMVLLKGFDSCTELYSFMGIHVHTQEQLYTDLILPNFQYLPTSVLPVHLTYIRDELLKKSAEFSDEQKQLIEKLKSVKFIEASNGTLQCASQFYSRDIKVFTLMCDQSEFAPPPYDQEVWQMFLKYAGLQDHVTSEHFLAYAKQVEKLGRQRMTTDVEEKSKALMACLGMMHEEYIEDGYALSQIKSIRFLLPHSITDECLGKELTVIYPQFGEGKHLVSYSESLAPHHCHYVWTSCLMFHHDADPSSWSFARRNYKELRSLFGLQDGPHPKKVLSHIQNICTSLANIQNQNSEGKLLSLDNTVRHVMMSIYRHLLNPRVRNKIKHCLKDLSIMYVPTVPCMVSADKIVKNIHPDELVKGYMYALPDQFTQFLDVFIDLGSSRDVHANLYACVLKTLYCKTEGRPLNSNDLGSVKKAVESMFNCLKREKKTEECTLQVSSLYLPDNKFQLTDSRHLVFNNNTLLSERVRSLDLQYFLGFQTLNLSEMNMDPLGFLAMLPERYRLQTLTSLVEENVDQGSKLRAYAGDSVKKYKTSVQGSEFVEAIVRLVNHEKYQQNEQSLEPFEAKSIEESLAHLKILQVKNLQTELRRNGNLVHQSKGKKRFCLESEKEGSISKTCLYINCEIHQVTLLVALETMIDELTLFKLGRSIRYVHHIFNSVPEMIRSHLDDFEIRTYNYFAGQREQTIVSSTGAFIPEEMHWLLDNSFDVFNEGEYVGLEVYDPITDPGVQDEVPENANPVYIYAVVKKVLRKEVLPIRRMYLVEVGEGRLEEMSGLKLYNVLRKNVNQCGDSASHTDQRCEENRHSLTPLWRNCSDEKERNTVKKRLYLAQHPDRNPDREAFFTKICSDIKRTAMELENEHAGATYPFFFEHLDKRSSEQQTRFQNYERRRPDQDPSKTNPQPHEAKRWLRQAIDDLAAAKDIFPPCRGFNWICNKTHQAAEKAVLAVWYSRSSTTADTLRSSNALTEITSGLDNSQLLDLATQLQSLVGDYSRMCYPDRLSFPSIPAAVYTESHARQACVLAESILELVKELFDVSGDTPLRF
ncbi:sacsin-like isoform X1 [Haliotis rufescens]|uniref:sacsin-like isoform X1 n=2 Tax=Haliotis rufescens TaxID=6454 RepID=UPI00201EA7E1|nr:sacsin-like isoform X1 [Haliotis rufescens]